VPIRIFRVRGVRGLLVERCPSHPATAGWTFVAGEHGAS
jgi:hypothetical protein